mmetsp:Transcript_71025/g.197292  ORF Transcript_71025/g.197292 Transcript_71025/m.197292 type:complete len:223 (+) Transcript_71025:172-840(+)
MRFFAHPLHASPRPMRPRSTSHVDLQRLAEELGLASAAEDPYAGLPEGDCPRYRGPILPERSCHSDQALVQKHERKAAASHCLPAPPHVCEEMRYAEASYKRVKDAVRDSWVLSRFQPKGVMQLEAAAAAESEIKDQYARRGEALPKEPLLPGGVEAEGGEAGPQGPTASAAPPWWLPVMLDFLLPRSKASCGAAAGAFPAPPPHRRRADVSRGRLTSADFL